MNVTGDAVWIAGCPETDADPPGFALFRGARGAPVEQRVGDIVVPALGVWHIARLDARDQLRQLLVERRRAIRRMQGPHPVAGAEEIDAVHAGSDHGVGEYVL